MPCSPQVKHISLIAFGVVLLILGLSLGLVLRSKIHNGLLTASRVCGTDDAHYDSWRTNTHSDSAPKYKLYHGFNTTNAVAYLTQTDTAPVNLTLNSVGPYAMRQYDTLYNISFSSDKKQVTYKTWSRFVFDKEHSCETCTQTDRFTGLNPAYLKTMTGIGSELIIGLLASNADLNYATYNPCNTTTIAYSFKVDQSCDPKNTSIPCCCTYRADPGTNVASCGARSATLLSAYAAYDNGVKLPNTMSSPLFITKNVHEFAYGYPSALLGLLAGGQAKSNPTALGALASYTEDVARACNYTSQGIAPTLEALEGKSYQYLALITCSPFQSTMYWAQVCPRLAPNNAACRCANPAHGENGLSTVARPCCLAVGSGCLYKITGYVSDEMYLTQDQAFKDAATDITTQNTGCGDFDTDEEFSWSRYENQTNPLVWANYTPLYTSPTAINVSIAQRPNAPQLERVTVQGSDGTRSKGVGRTSGSFSKELTDGQPRHKVRNVFITQTSRATQIHFKESTKYKGVTVSKYSPLPDFLNQGVQAVPENVDNGKVGAATPFSGVQEITYMTGFPAYVSRPMFLYGDSNALTQSADGSAGLEIYEDGKLVQPEASKYETYLNVEPATGLTFEGHKRLMASFGLWRCTDPALQGCTGGGLANVFSRYVPGGKVIPQYWMDETSQATSDQISKFKTLQDRSYSVDVILLVLTLFGSLFIIAGAVMLLLTKRKPRKLAVVSESLMSNMQS